ncbi:MAG: permease prefix domain 1-containing protein, partial [Longimicrobiales bacterium]
MRWFRNVWFRLRATFTPGRMEQQMDEEMAFHMDMEAKKLMREGVSPADALHQARRRFGDPMREKERARGVWG